MVEIVQYFNGERRRLVGRARSSQGVIRRVKGLVYLGAGWGVKIHGTRKALLDVGCGGTPGNIRFDYVHKRTKSVTRWLSVACVEDPS